ncbi:MAG: bifunctional diaminohydroxyphosphoribosylaminopyrimidine deaminase/5-amino-6-(5-phosphoribosylamino)uracil reductase RibD [Desulfobacterales bacterium]|nr:bifunctional diaminohydroxyphosphoribosylaminopyrimidine deaminase/5-amino-6-(5-phosphoribosylamino)uracil reductase RibD [Desulfobacterales bacterium]
MTDLDYMKLALSLARRGKGFTSPNPCVGAVVVKDGEIVGRGWHHACGMPHAEVEAIDDAKGNTQGATIYVTLEPCNHFGKTPPCTHKILNAGITRVVVACKDPNPFVSGGGIQFLKDKGLEVESGLLEADAEVLIEDFIWYTRNEKRPFVILKSAATLDGRIATSTGDSKWITNPKSRAYGHRVRHEVDAILIGSGTLHADDPSLTARLEDGPGKDPMRVILDSQLSINPEAKVLTQKSDAPTLMVVGPHASFEKRKFLEEKGIQIMEVPLKNGTLDLEQVVIKLGKMSVTSLLIEGGGKVASSALRAGIVNKVLYFLAPKFLGGSDGTPVYNGKGPEKIADAFHLDRISLDTLDGDILVRGYLKP